MGVDSNIRAHIFAAFSFHSGLSAYIGPVGFGGLW